MQAAAAVVGVLVGFVIALLLIAITGGVFLWLYGAFWTTSAVILLAGDSSQPFHFFFT